MAFKTSWKSSKQTRKQRKYRYNAPLHIKRKFLSSHLSKELQEKYQKRAIPLRTGDKVKVLRGDFKGKTGTVERTVIKKEMIYVNGLEVIKKDGTKQLKPLKPSNLLIINMVSDDKKRKKSMEKKK